jgi:hypothetical protein
METGSHHRELAEEPWKTSAQESDQPGQAAPHSPVAPQRPAPESNAPKILRELSWLDILAELKNCTSSLKPLVMEKYRKARKTGTRERIFKKGSVVDEAS